MKKKVKKFGRGGDILTGLGAGLLGYSLYKKLKGDDDKPPAKKEPEVSITEPKEKERSAEEKRALATSKGRPELFPEGTTDADKATMYSDNYPTPKPKPAVKKVVPAAQSTKVEPRAKATDKVGVGYENIGKTAPKTRGITPTSSGAKGTQDVGKALGMSSNAKGTQTLGERIQSTVENAGKSVVRTPQQRMADAAKEVEARRKREAEGMKKGGKVKKSDIKQDKAMIASAVHKHERAKHKGQPLTKMAKGGSVSSASKRADGCATKGKTKGRFV